MFKKTSVLLAAALAAPLMTTSAFAQYDTNVAIVNGDLDTLTNGPLNNGQDVYVANSAGQDGWRTWADNNNGAALRAWNPSDTNRYGNANNEFFDFSWGGNDASGDADGYVLTVRTQAWDYRNASGIGATTNLAQRWKDDYNNRIWNVVDGSLNGAAAGEPALEWRYDNGGTPVSGTGVVGDPYVWTDSNYLQTDINGDYTGWTGTATRDFEAATQILTATFNATSKYVLSVEVGRLHADGLNSGEVDHDGNGTIDGTSSRFFNDAPALWDGYNVELMTGGVNTVVGSTYAGGVYEDAANPLELIANENSLALAENSWGTSTVAYTPGISADVSSQDGKNLTIRLSALETVGAHQNTNVVAFDDVVLTEIKAGDANEDGDVDVFSFDGTGDAQVLTSNLGTTTGMTWANGDFNGDGDVDVFQFDGGGDAQLLTNNLGIVVAAASEFTLDAVIGVDDAIAQTAEVFYNSETGEVTLDIGSSVGVVGIQSNGNVLTGNFDAGSIFGAAAQLDANVVAFFNPAGLTEGEDSIGNVLATGLSAGDISFSYTPLGESTVFGIVTVVPEPSSLALLGLGGLAMMRRRRA